MDDLDLRITKLLGQDGRMSYREIARHLNISEPTARHRVKRLLDSGKISIKAQINIDESPEVIIAYVGLKQTAHPQETLDMISNIKEVIYAVNTIGRYDIIAVIAVRSRERLADILTNEIIGKNRQNISSSETHVVLYNRNLLVPAENIINSILDERNNE
ncbi:MAG: Lrp/AsnC family transcriptional regulator [Candidatus Latescibacteria bacterium]|nr:Lrp/AsnC family transcriptional regulator [Candidatus Latescibacterota bacterium]